jgi:Mycobacterium 19 kDa lipoprotein antigen
MKPLLMAAVIPAAIGLAPLAHADGYNIIINGVTQPKGPAGNSVSCGMPVSGIPNSPIHIVFGAGTSYVNLSPDGSTVRQVLVGDSAGTTYLFPGGVNGLAPTDATVTKSGNTYQITGHISPYMTRGIGGDPGRVSNPTAVPFELDATCP